MGEMVSRLTLELDQSYWEVGDRFIFVKNHATPESDHIELGFKGVVEEVLDGYVFCIGWAFSFDEIKKLLKVNYENVA